MRDYVIVTDSSCDLPAKLVEELELQVVPLAFTLGETTYRNYPDNREMEPEAFYARLAAGEMATTTAVNVGQAMDILEPILQGGKDVLVLGFSSGLSATFHSFQMAAAELADRYRQRRAYAVDTLCASLGQGMLVAQAARLRQQGMDMDQVRSWVLDNRLHQCHWFTVNDLNFLKRGGRVSAATALVGTMLQIKPVMHMDDAGHLINMAKARGRKASLLELVDKVRELGTQPDQQTMYVSHSACLEDAQFVADEVKRRYGVKEVILNNIGPVIGAHTGPGCVALFFTGSKR